MKKIVAIFLILTALFAVGCGKKDDIQSGQTSSDTVCTEKAPDFESDEITDALSDISDSSDTDNSAAESKEDTKKAESEKTDPEETEAIDYTVTDESGTLIIYPEFPEQVRRTYDYDVSVTMGKRTRKLPVYNHEVESNVSRRPGVDMYRRFSMFAFDGGSVRVDIKVKQDFKRYTVFPSAKNFKSDFKDGVISVYLDEPDYFGIQLDDDVNTILAVFSDLPESGDELPKEGEKVIRVEGWFEPGGDGIYELKENNTVLYIAPGSVLNARVKVSGANCRIIGRGAIIDPYENLYEYDIRVGGTEGKGTKLLVINGNNTYVDGPILIDARCFNIYYQGKNQTLKNVKVMSSMMNTDAVTASGTGGLVEHCWFYVGDNAVVPSNATDITFRDITVGTTCAAFYPQFSCTNLLFEDICVFRADDGIINNRYNGAVNLTTRKDRTHTVTFRRLSAVEIPASSTHFFQTGNMGGSLEKTFNFEKISLPKMTKDVWYYKLTYYIDSFNYNINFSDYYEGGKCLSAKNELVTDGDLEGSKTTFTFKNSTGYKPVTRNEKTVNYVSRDKIYFGLREVYFDISPKVQNSKVMLPAKDIYRLLNKKYTGDAKYVSSDELIKAGLIGSAVEKHGTYYITPSYNGENLIIPDEGEISFFAEQACYDVDIVVTKDKDGYIFNQYTIESRGAGISRRVTDEFRTYGEGTYRVTFKARTDSDKASLALRLQTDAKEEVSRFTVAKNWTEISFDYDVTSEMLEAAKNVFVINYADGDFESFAIRDFEMVKIK